MNTKNTETAKANIKDLRAALALKNASPIEFAKACTQHPEEVVSLDSAMAVLTESAAQGADTVKEIVTARAYMAIDQAVLSEMESLLREMVKAQAAVGLRMISNTLEVE